MTLFMVVGCGATRPSESASDSSEEPTSQKSSDKSSSDKSSSSSGKSSSSSSSSGNSSHAHTWSTEWSYDENSHYHKCTQCDAKNDVTPHTLGSSQTVNLGAHLNDTRYKHSTVKIKSCTCGYDKIEDGDVFPRLYFNFESTYNGIFKQSCQSLYWQQSTKIHEMVLSIQWNFSWCMLCISRFIPTTIRDYFRRIKQRFKHIRCPIWCYHHCNDGCSCVGWY